MTTKGHARHDSSGDYAMGAGDGTRRLAMGPEKRITEALEYSRSRLERAKEKYGVLRGDVEPLDNGAGIGVTLGDKFMFLLLREQLLAPSDDAAFQRMLRSTWDRELENWEWRRRKDTPRGKHGLAKGDRGGTRPPPRR